MNILTVLYLFVSDDASASNHIMASQLHNIRMKLEEKRRRIESEKRRMEVVMSKQRQKVGKAAFLQAVTKVSRGGAGCSGTSKFQALWYVTLCHWVTSSCLLKGHSAVYLTLMMRALQSFMMAGTVQCHMHCCESFSCCNNCGFTRHVSCS